MTFHLINIDLKNILSLTSETLIAKEKKKNSEFKLFFKNDDREPQINVKDIFNLFDKNEVYFFLDDYSLKLNKFKQFLELVKVNEHPPENVDISLHKTFRWLQNKMRSNVTRKLKFREDVKLVPKVSLNRG